MSERDSVVQRLAVRYVGWFTERRHALYGLALFRMGIGGITIAMLALYAPNFSYSFGRAARWGEPLQSDSSVNDYWWPLLSIFSRDDPDWLLYVKAIILGGLSVAFLLGWKTRIIAPVFAIFWLSFSALNPAITNTGHYQSVRVFLVFLVFADLSRVWALDARHRRKTGRDPLPLVARLKIPDWVGTLSNNFAVVFIVFQVCVIYVTSALWKLQGSTWVTGTAVYYPLRVEELTLFPALNEWVWAATPVVFVASWISVYAQLLFPLMLLNRWSRLVGIVLVTGMHAGIGVLLALPFFSVMMIAADMVLIRSQTWRLVADHLGSARTSLWGWVRKRTGGLSQKADLTPDAASH